MLNLWNGKPGREGDHPPFAPIRDNETLALKLQKADNEGYFKTRTDMKWERNYQKHLLDVQWILSQAAKKGLIDRKQYKKRTDG